MADNSQPNQAIARAGLALIAMCVLCGCATTDTVSPAVGGNSAARQLSGSKGHVDIFRGLGGYLPGRKQLQERLADSGISSTTRLAAQAGQVARRILDRRAGGDDSPIVLMGYAVGGGGTRQVADLLKEHGVEVDAIILIDPSFFEPVPSNVRRCFVAYRPEVWQSWNSIMRGNPVKTESDRTVVVRVNLTEEDEEGALSGESHLTITANEWVQKMLVQQAARETGR